MNNTISSSKQHHNEFSKYNTKTNTSNNKNNFFLNKNNDLEVEFNKNNREFLKRDTQTIVGKSINGILLNNKHISKGRSDNKLDTDNNILTNSIRYQKFKFLNKNNNIKYGDYVNSSVVASNVFFSTAKHSKLNERFQNIINSSLNYNKKISKPNDNMVDKDIIDIKNNKMNIAKNNYIIELTGNNNIHSNYTNVGKRNFKSSIKEKITENETEKEINMECFYEDKGKEHNTQLNKKIPLYMKKNKFENINKFINAKKNAQNEKSQRNSVNNISSSIGIPDEFNNSPSNRDIGLINKLNISRINDYKDNNINIYNNNFIINFNGNEGKKLRKSNVEHIRHNVYDIINDNNYDNIYISKNFNNQKNLANYDYQAIIGTNKNNNNNINYINSNNNNNSPNFPMPNSPINLDIEPFEINSSIENDDLNPLQNSKNFKFFNQKKTILQSMDKPIKVPKVQIDKDNLDKTKSEFIFISSINNKALLSVPDLHDKPNRSGYANGETPLKTIHKKTLSSETISNQSSPKSVIYTEEPLIYYDSKNEKNKVNIVNFGANVKKYINVNNNENIITSDKNNVRDIISKDRFINPKISSEEGIENGKDLAQKVPVFKVCESISSQMKKNIYNKHIRHSEYNKENNIEKKYRENEYNNNTANLLRSENYEINKHNELKNNKYSFNNRKESNKNNIGYYNGQNDIYTKEEKYVTKTYKKEGTHKNYKKNIRMDIINFTKDYYYLFFLTKNNYKLMLNIIGFLDIKSLAKFSSVSKKLYLVYRKQYFDYFYNKLLEKRDIKFIKNVFISVFRYSNLRPSTFQDISDTYEFFLKKPTEYNDLIKKDLSRTFPKDESFKKGKENYEKLYKILWSYSNFNPKIGYAQGINFLAGISMSMFYKEEMCFLFIDSMINKFSLGDFMLIGTKDVSSNLTEFDNVLKKYVPDIVCYLNDIMLGHEFFTTGWLITLFSNSMEKNYLQVTWCFMIIFGKKFYYIFISQIMKHFKKDIFESEENNLNSTMKTLLKSKNFFKDYNNIIKSTFEVMRNNIKMI